VSIVYLHMWGYGSNTWYKVLTLLWFNVSVQVVTVPQAKKLWGGKYLILANFGVLNTKITLNIENWLWLPSYRRDLLKISYSPADGRVLSAEVLCERIPRRILFTT